MNRPISLLPAIGILCWGMNLFGQGSPTILWQQQHSDRVNSVVFSPDGQTLISGSSDRLINFWRVSDGTLTQSLNVNADRVHESSIEWLAISTDGSRLASCSYKVVKLWKLPAGSEQQLTGHNDWVVGVAFSPGGTYLASASFDGTIKIWRGTDGSLVKTLNVGGGEMRSVAFSPNGQYLAGAGSDGAVRIWQLSDWSLVHIMTGHTSDVYVMAFSPDGTSLASGGYDHTARVWNTSTWTSRYTINASGNVYALAFTKDSSQIAVSDGEANHISVYRVANGTLIKQFDQQVNNVQTIAFSQGGLMGYGRADSAVVLANYNDSASTPPPKTDPPPTTPPTSDPPSSTGSNPLKIFWQNGGNGFQGGGGVLSGWSMDGTNRVGTFKINNGRGGGSNWRVFGVGDFDGDGSPDFAWQNAGGATALWFMNDGSISSSSALRDGTKIDPRWRLAGAGDLNGDGKSDLLFQNAAGLVRVWMVDGNTVTDSELLFSGQPLNRGWRVAATGDFNHDGNTDLVLENSQGVIEIQLMNGTEPGDLIPLRDGAAAKGWRVVGTADFDGDGETDLVLEHSSNFIAVWFMNGTTFTSAAYLNGGKRIPAGWRIVGVTK